MSRSGTTKFRRPLPGERGWESFRSEPEARREGPAVDTGGGGINRRLTLALGPAGLRRELLRTRSPRRFWSVCRRIVTQAPARLFGNAFRFARLALKARRSVRRGRLGRATTVARKLVAAAPDSAHRAVAEELREAIGSADPDRAMRVATHATRIGDLGAPKMVSRKYRFLFISTPKVASQSFRRALRAVDPEAETFEELSTVEVLALRPEARGWFRFAFVRDPFDRAVSLYAEKFLGEKRKKRTDWAGRLQHHGLSLDMDFDSFCAWLAGPWGADVFADRHWLSQHLQIATAGGRMPDFVGRLETIEDDLATVAGRIGLPDLDLPVLNTSAGWEADRDAMEAERLALKEKLLTDRARELLRRRYADDFRILGYDPG